MSDLSIPVATTCLYLARANDAKDARTSEENDAQGPEERDAKPEENDAE